MELFVYSGTQHLPSIDYDCLRLMTFVKLNDLPVKITPNGNPFSSPNGFLPYLQCEGQRIAGYESIIEKLKPKIPSHSTTLENLSDSYMCLLNQELEPYRKYLLWGDPINVDAVRGMYATRIRFPFNFSHPQKYMKDAQDFLKIFANFDINDKVQNHNTSLLLVKAKKFLNLLADKLGERDWFLDHRSSEFDASIYAMLSILTDFPANNNEVKIHISQCPNLVRFMKRIRVKYYTDLGLVTTESNGIVTKVKHLVINKKTNSLSNGAIKFIAGFTAVTSMILFAISHGLLEIRTDDGEDEGYEYSNYIEDGDDGMGDDE